MNSPITSETNGRNSEEKDACITQTYIYIEREIFLQTFILLECPCGGYAIDSYENYCQSILVLVVR